MHFSFSHTQAHTHIINDVCHPSFTIFSILRCRMRSSDLSTLPVIILAPPSHPSLNVSLPFPSLNSWQWVSASINFILESSGSVSVTMATSQTESGNSQSVFFDDLCANSVQEGKFYSLHIHRHYQD